MGIMQLLHLIFIYAVQFRYLIFWFLTIRRKQSFQAEKRNYLKSWPLFVFGWGAAMASCVWTRYPASRLCTAPSPQPSSSVTTPELFTFQFSAENIWKIGRRQAGWCGWCCGWWAGGEKFINSGQSPAPARSITPPRSQSSTDTDHGPWTDTRWSQSLSCFNNHDIDIDIKHYFRFESQCLS